MRLPARFALTGVLVVIFGMLAPLAAAPVSAAPTTIFVGPTRTYTTIQAGINAAVNGDTVSVDVKGSAYVENVAIDGKYITLKPTSAMVTIRSAAARNAALQIVNAPSHASFRNEVFGFTFTGGNSGEGQGGGVTIFNSSPVLRDCIIEGNRAQYGGGVSVIVGSNPFIHNNIIRNNSASQGGAGIFVNINSVPTIVRNTITGNIANGPWTGIPGGGPSGAGIYMLNLEGNQNAYVQPIVLGNTISSNTANFAGGGIIIGKGINAVVEDNTINANSAAYGGGIHLESVTSQPILDSNRITNNAAITTIYTDAGQGGGISVYNQSRPTISNNTITGNTASNGGGGITAAEKSTSLITGNLISNNIASKAGYPNADGAGIHVAQANVTIASNAILSNTAENNGGGISIADMVVSGITYSADISHNTIAKNLSPTTLGGAIYVSTSAGSKVTITNNILTLNQGVQILDFLRLARIDNNLITEPGTPAAFGSGLLYFYLPGTSNGVFLTTASAINSDPNINASNNLDASAQFVNAAAQDFRLTSTSPAIGAATTVSVPPVSLDVRGVQRSTPLDVGAYEYSAQPVAASQPVLTGSAEVSKTLLITAGTWGPTPGVVSYQWRVDGQPVSGATSGVFAPRLEDVGKQVNVVVTVTKYGVYTRSFTSNMTSPVLRGPYFADVPTSQPFYSPIMWMYDRGISTGNANPPFAPLFKPSDPVTRQAMALFLYRLSGETFAPPTQPTFADVTVVNSPLFYTAIEWMSFKRISTGTAQPEGKPLYKPAEPVSREVMGIFLARFASVDVSVPPTELSFADVPVNSQYAAALAWMKAAGISTGTAQPTGLPLYKPQDPVSRQALSAFLFRFDHLP